MSDNKLEVAIQDYLNSIIELSPNYLPITQYTLSYLEQRVYGAYIHELGKQRVNMIVDENRNISFTISRGDFI